MSANSLRAGAETSLSRWERNEAECSTGGQSVKTDIFEFDGQVVNTARRGSDPAGEFSGLNYASHEGAYKRVVGIRREPHGRLALPMFLGQDFAFRVDKVAREIADLPVESHVRQSK